MHLRMIFATVTGIAFLLMISTQDLRAAEAANPGSGERTSCRSQGGVARCRCCLVG